MSGYFIRIQQIPTYDEKITALTHQADYASILCFKHIGDSKENPHYHLVVKTQIKNKAFRARFVKIFDKGKGNTHMSIKEWDGSEDAYSYMFHEGGVPYLRHNLTEIDVARFHSMNERVQEEIKISKGKASYHLVEITLAQLTRNEVYSDLHICMIVLREAFLKDKYKPNDYQMRSIIDEIQYKNTDQDSNSQEAVIFSIAKRILKLN